MGLALVRLLLVLPVVLAAAVDMVARGVREILLAHHHHRVMMAVGLQMLEVAAVAVGHLLPELLEQQAHLRQRQVVLVKHQP
jgi:hypothetical protein